MRYTLSGMVRALAVTGLFLLSCLVSPAWGQGREQVLEDSAFFREFPLALVYRGVALYAAKDYEGAIAAWQGYLARAGNDSDSAGVNELIRDAWVHAYPLSLVYDSYARHEAGDIVGAIASLERYIEMAPPGEDTAAVRQMIVKVLIPEQEMAKISVDVSWFVDHELRQIVEDLNPPATFATSGMDRKRSAELRSLKRKQSFQPAAYRVVKQL